VGVNAYTLVYSWQAFLPARRAAPSDLIGRKAGSTRRAVIVFHGRLADPTDCVPTSPGCWDRRPSIQGPRVARFILTWRG